MATNKTIPNPLPFGTEQLAVIHVTGQIENVARAATDRQTANNRVGSRADKKRVNLQTYAKPTALHQHAGHEGFVNNSSEILLVGPWSNF